MTAAGAFELGVLAGDGTLHRFVLTPRPSKVGRRWAFSRGGREILSVREFSGELGTATSAARGESFGGHLIHQVFGPSPETALFALLRVLVEDGVTAEQLLGEAQ